ncbi:MAG: alpha/beta hydrolase, partial [Faecousia sp.]
YEKYASNLPEGSVEIILEGGNHAGFGAYGPQKKDGAPNISPESQWAQTADAIIAMCSQS